MAPNPDPVMVRLCPWLAVPETLETTGVADAANGITLAMISEIDIFGVMEAPSYHER